MNELVLDIKIIIASHDEKIWYWFYRHDAEFKKYSKRKMAIHLFTKLFTICKNDSYCFDMYYLLGKLHRVDGPAIIYKGNSELFVRKGKISTKYSHKYHEYEIWMLGNKVHRNNDLPAITKHNKDVYEQTWYCKDRLHRENDLPALTNDVRQVWYYRGKIHRDGDLPAVIYYDTKSWYHKGKLHRENDLPAIMCDDELVWYCKGKMHRENGLPTMINI